MARAEELGMPQSPYPPPTYVITRQQKRAEERRQMKKVMGLVRKATGPRRGPTSGEILTAQNKRLQRAFRRATRGKQ